MPSTEKLKEAERVMVICNACRYCEGFCAVFPAMELRRSFLERDLIYLANLCHNCRGCYYACQYAPPHEFEVNVPKIFSELRAETYRDMAWPGFMAGLFRRNGLAVTLIAGGSVLVVMLLTFFFQDPSILFAAQLGEGAFFRIIPYELMVWPAMGVSLYIGVALLVGVIRFWRDTGGTWRELVDPQANRQAMWDALKLKYLEGGGHGCNYPDGDFSHARRWFHHLTFYGFMLDLASTTLAAIYHNVFHWHSPYPYLSGPVVLGTLGGIGLLIGPAGLLWLKWHSDPAPANRRLFSMDVAFLVMLFLTSLTGLVLLALRETPAMGTLLALHLGVVLGLFLTMPYGKFVHAIYRYAALVRHSIEQSRQTL